MRAALSDLGFDGREAVVRDLLEEVFVDTEAERVEVRALVLGQ